MTDSRFGAFEEQTMECTILATVLKRYLASLIIPVIPAEHHVNFLEIASGFLSTNYVEYVRFKPYLLFFLCLTMMSICHRS